MSLHLASATPPLPICGGNAARLTDDPDNPGLNCHLCERIIESIRRGFAQVGNGEFGQRDDLIADPKSTARPPHPLTMIGRK